MPNIPHDHRLKIAPTVLAVLGLLVLGHGLVNFIKAQSTAPTQRPSDPSRVLNDLEKDINLQKDRLTSIIQQSSQVQSLLSTVLVAAGLLTLLQGVFAFFSAQDYANKAKTAITEAESATNAAKKEAESAHAAIKTVIDASDAKMKSLVEDIVGKFPMFSNIENARAVAFNKLCTLASRLDLDTENIYASAELTWPR